MPALAYHRLPHVSRSQLDDFRESPWGYYRRHVLKDPSWQVEVTPDMQNGTLLHSLVMEHPELIWEPPQTFGELAVYPREVLNKNGDRGTNACKEWEAVNADKILRKEGDLEELWQWARMLTKGKAAEFLEHPDRLIEKTVIWKHVHEDGTAIDLRTRLDLVIPGERIVDLKKCCKGDINDIENVIARSGYDFQAACYQLAWEYETNQRLQFTFIFQESAKPYRTSVWTMDQSWVDENREKVIDTLTDLKAAADSGDWSDPLSKVEMTAYKPKWKTYQYQKVSA